MSRIVTTLCAIAVLSVASVGSAKAADPFRTAASGESVSQSSLSAMGLSGMKVMEREDSVEVRGQGAIVFGVSYARFNGFFNNSGSVNGYFANNPTFSGGFSFAGANGPGPFVYGTGFSFAGGF